MQIVLMHNPTAGSGDHTVEDLIACIERAGHTVAADISCSSELGAAVRVGCDLVAVAGGDGTIGRAAEVMIGSSVPLAALPLGTANNIARTLGFVGAFDELIATWNGSTRQRFDMATVSSGGQTRHFLECLGLGAFTETVRESRRLPERARRADTLRQHLALVRAVVATAETRRYRVHVDGVDHTGDYLLAEVMNVPFLGPHLALAPNASPHDGLLDVVLVGPRDRTMLLDHIDAVIEGSASTATLPVVRAQRVTIATTDDQLHRDGHLEPTGNEQGARDLRVEVLPGALQVLRRQER